MTKLYYLESLPGQNHIPIHRYLSLLPDYEQKKILAFRFKEDAQLSLYSKLLLLLSFKDLNIEIKDLKDMALTGYKKPFIKSLPDFHFNISHCRGAIITAVSNECQIGVDIEKIEPVDINLFKNIFKLPVLTEINNSTNPTNAFYYFWTIYEAALKAHGKGFLADLKDVNLTGTSVLIEDKTWFTTQINIGDGFTCSFAASNEVINPEILRLTMEDFLHRIGQITGK